MLSIKPKQGLPSGTVIKNRAEIKFEIFAPLLTNQVVNIIDAFPPKSAMKPLPPVMNQKNFPISWNGRDSIGEIDNYSIFVAVDSGLFTEIAHRTKDTTMIFNGEVGKTYKFLCVAEDQAGNIELKSQTAEAITKVVTTATNEPKPTKSTHVILEQNFPNPTNQLTTITYILPSIGKVELNIYDVFGKRIRQLINKTEVEGQHSDIWDGKNENGQDVTNGIYFYQIRFKDEMIIKKVVIMHE